MKNEILAIDLDSRNTLIHCVLRARVAKEDLSDEDCGFNVLKITFVIIISSIPEEL